MGLSIGIDLGTTTSVVGYIKGGRPEVVPFKPYSHTTAPSVVQARDGEILVGAEAKENMPFFSKDTIWSIKRFMGRSPGDPDLERARQLVPYRVDDPPAGKADLAVHFNGSVYTPVDISAMILRKLVEDASEALGQRPTDAVITVPAYFSERQIEATRRAGRQAGLNVRRVLDEPTAAALAYGLDLDSSVEKTILVFDLGGGTFDVSILMLTGGQFTTVTIAGDNFLGGDDFDNVLLEHFMEILSANNPGIREEASARAHLKKLSEAAKIALSSTNVHRVDAFLQIREDRPPVRLSTKVERSWFEAQCKPLVERATNQVFIALKKAGMERSEIQNVVMVGGSTGIPAVVQAVQSIFDESKISRGLNPMLCVAQGAAILAESFGEGRTESELVQCCTSKPRGIELEDGGFDTIIAAQTYYPMDDPEWRDYRIAGRGQRQLKIAVYEGEDQVARKNEWQGDVVIDFSEALPEGTPVRVGIRLDNSGTTLLSVEVERRPNAVKEAKVERTERGPDPRTQQDNKKKPVDTQFVLRLLNMYLMECEGILGLYPTSKKLLMDGLNRLNRAIEISSPQQANTTAEQILTDLNGIEPPVEVYFFGKIFSQRGGNPVRQERLRKGVREADAAIASRNVAELNRALGQMAPAVQEQFDESGESNARVSSFAGLRRG